MEKTTRFVGLDVHKASIAVAVADAFGDPEDHGQIANDPSAVRKLVARLGGADVQLAVAYEAGPTGYALQRQLTAMGIGCMVVAPSLIPTRPGDRVKTDRRDAAKLARLLRSGDLTPVWVPDEAHEALRDLVRDRDDAKEDLLRAKHRLSKFLLRHGIHPPAGVRAWSRAHEAWLNRLVLDQRADQVVFDDYWSVVRDAKDRVRRLETALVACAAESPHGEYLAALQAIRGIGFISAVTIVAEAGDLRRFPTARAFMAYVGLVPSEYSSGGSRHRGRITKTGNRLIRHVLGQAAHNARFRPNVSSALRARQRHVPAPVVELDRRAQARLHHRYRHLVGRIGPNKAVTAVARELAGFVWALGRLVEPPIAA
jgi:transposase